VVPTPASRSATAQIPRTAPEVALAVAPLSPRSPCRAAHVFYLLEAQGLDPWLVNVKDVRHLPGRPKTDKLDAVWLRKVVERQMIRSSFVPPPQAAGCGMSDDQGLVGAQLDRRDKRDLCRRASGSATRCGSTASATCSTQTTGRTRRPKCGQNCGQGRFLRGSALAL
jgi:hypothetical protein